MAESFDRDGNPKLAQQVREYSSACKNVYDEYNKNPKVKANIDIMFSSEAQKIALQRIADLDKGKSTAARKY